jgi:hypothetical protein
MFYTHFIWFMFRNFHCLYDNSIDPCLNNSLEILVTIFPIVCGQRDEWDCSLRAILFNKENLNLTVVYIHFCRWNSTCFIVLFHFKRMFIKSKFRIQIFFDKDNRRNNVRTSLDSELFGYRQDTGVGQFVPKRKWDFFERSLSFKFGRVGCLQGVQ